jgi:hypothetical protein
MPQVPEPNGIAPRLATTPGSAGASQADSAPDGAGRASAEAVKLPLDLLDQLLASTVVPHEAKLASIEAWRRELAEAELHDPALGLGAVHDRLSAARRLLTLMRQRTDSDPPPGL